MIQNDVEASGGAIEMHGSCSCKLVRSTRASTCILSCFATQFGQEILKVGEVRDAMNVVLFQHVRICVDDTTTDDECDLTGERAPQVAELLSDAGGASWIHDAHGNGFGISRLGAGCDFLRREIRAEIGNAPSEITCCGGGEHGSEFMNLAARGCDDDLRCILTALTASDGREQILTDDRRAQMLCARAHRPFLPSVTQRVNERCDDR